MTSILRSPRRVHGEVRHHDIHLDGLTPVACVDEADSAVPELFWRARWRDLVFIIASASTSAGAYLTIVHRQIKPSPWVTVDTPTDVSASRVATEVVDHLVIVREVKQEPPRDGPTGAFR